MQKLSAVIITFNEEQRIAQALESVKWCDEIVVVDSFSTDGTVEICKKYSNCEVYTNTFLGYGAQKQYAVSLASNKWVLSIDADEVITEKLSNEIRIILSQPSIKYSGFLIPRTLVFMGKIFVAGREYKKKILRLFNKDLLNFNDDVIHEKIVPECNTTALKNHMLHFSYSNVFNYFEKLNSYTTIAAEGLLKKKRKGSKFVVFIKFPFNFFKCYIVDLNFINGYEGFMWALFSSLYKVVKSAKHIEMLNKVV